MTDFIVYVMYRIGQMSCYPSKINSTPRKKQCGLGKSNTTFYLSTLEATYIKTSKPDLCKQKEFLYGLKIAH